MRDSKYIFMILFLFVIGVIPMNAPAIEYVSSFGGVIRSAVAYQHYLFLSQQDSIVILDVQDKKQIRKIGEYTESGTDTGQLTIKWPVVFFEVRRIGSVYDTVRALNVSDPSHPRIIKNTGFHWGKGFCEHFITGSRLIIIFNEDDGYSYDITNPLMPVLLVDENGERISVSKDAMHATSSSQASIPSIPNEIFYVKRIEGINTTDHRIQILNDKNKVDEFDVSNPLTPRYVGSESHAPQIMIHKAVDETSSPQSVRIDQKYEITLKKIADDDGSQGCLVIQNISTLSSNKKIKKMGEPDTPLDRIRDFWLVGKRLIVIRRQHNTAMSIHTLSIYDLSNPEKPKFMGYYGDGAGDSIHRGFTEVPTSIAISGNLVYVAADGYLTILRFDKKENGYLK